MSPKLVHNRYITLKTTEIFFNKEQCIKILNHPLAYTNGHFSDLNTVF